MMSFTSINGVSWWTEILILVKTVYCLFFPFMINEFSAMLPQSHKNILQCFVSERLKWELLSVHFSCSVVSDSFWSHGLQHTRFPCPSLTPGACSTHIHQVTDTVQPSHPPSASSSPALFNLSQNQGLFQWVSSFHQVAKVLEFQL